MVVVASGQPAAGSHTAIASRSGSRDPTHVHVCICVVVGGYGGTKTCLHVIRLAYMFSATVIYSPITILGSYSVVIFDNRILARLLYMLNRPAFALKGGWVCKENRYVNNWPLLSVGVLARERFARNHALLLSRHGMVYGSRTSQSIALRETSSHWTT